MEIVKIVNKSYETKKAMINLVFYVSSGSEEIGGFGLSMASPETVLYEFEAIKRYWNKNEEGRRQVRHIIVSFEEDYLRIDDVRKLAWLIAEYYGNHYQVFYGIHDNTEHIHIHFVVNTVSFVDGKMISEGFADLQNFINYVKETKKAYLLNKQK